MKKPGKVVFLISNNFVHDNRTYRQAKALVEAGWDVTILCPLVAAKLPKEETVEGIKVKRVLDDWLPTVPKCKVQLEECKKYLASVLNEKADLYISKDLDTLFYGWRAAKKYRAKLIYNADEYWQDLTVSGLGPKTRIYYKVAFFLGERFLAKKADLVTTVNEPLAEKLQQVLHLRRKPVVIMNAPDSVKIKKNGYLEKETGFNDKKVVLYLGMFGEGRGLENLISAAKYLDDNVAIALFGYGNLKESLEKLIKEEKVEDKVRIFDPIPYDKMLNVASGATIGIIPVLPISTSYEYCLPNKFFEYVLADLPICSSRLPVLSQLIEKYRIGATFEPGNTKDLARVIQEMIYNEKRYMEYKKNLKFAARELNWAVEKVKFLRAIEEL